MIITALTQGKRDKARVNISIDGEYKFALDKDLLIEYGLFVGKELTEVELNKIESAGEGGYLYRRMLEYWFRHPRSSRELRKKLEELAARRELEGETAERVIEQVLERLAAAGYNDSEFARWFVGERTRQGKYGSRKLLSELAARSVPAKIAQEVVAELFTEEQAAGIKVLAQRFGVEKLSEIKDPKQKAKAYRFLVSRGFIPSRF